MPYIIILINFEERMGDLWNICLVQKQRANGAFQKDECRNFVRERIPRVSKFGSMWLIPKGAEKPIDGRTKKERSGITNEAIIFIGR